MISEQEFEQKAKALFTPRNLIIGVVALFSFIGAMMSVYTVDEGHVGIVKRFGEATKQVSPGLQYKVPFMDDVEILEVRTRKSDEQLAAATSEQMPVQATVSINWTAEKAEALNLFKEYGSLEQFESRILDPKLRSAAKDAIARYKAEDLVKNRSQAIATIEELLKEQMTGYPIKLDSAQLENLNLPKKYLQSIETKQTELNLSQAEEHRLARQKLEAQREVNTAEAQRDAAKAKADGQAYAIKVNAEAEAEAIRVKGLAEAEAIEKRAAAIGKNQVLVDYQRALQWDGRMPTTMMGEGGAGVLMDMRSKR